MRQPHGGANLTQPLQRADWITIEELMQLTGWSRRTIFNKQRDGELRTRLTEQAAANGKRRREYDASDLPAELQAQRMQHSLAPASAQSSTLARPLVRTLATLDQESQAQARERLAIIQPILDFVNSGQEPLCLGSGVTNISGIARQIAEVSGHSERTVWRWWNAYKEGGPGALADRPRQDRNVSRFFFRHKDAAQFVINKFLNERLSITMVHLALLHDWIRLRSAPADPPCFETVRSFIDTLPPIITAVAHHGERAYKEDFAPFLLRDRSRLRANQYWVSDHMQHDVWVRNFDDRTGGPAFAEMPLNTAFRPWLTAIEDMKSRRMLAMVWCSSPSSNSISSALRFALENYGRPQSAFYVDNGKDYNKVSDDARGVLARLGISTQHCTPRHPQAKQIESFFHTLHQRFDVLWRPAYAGTSPKTRPEECDKLLREHKRLLDLGKGNSSSLPAASEFIHLAAQWLDDFNHTFTDRAPGLAGRTPVEIFDTELPASSRAALKPAEITHLFWDRQKRVVREGGTVQLLNARYEPADAESAAALTLNIQREVLVACDPLNVGKAIALTLDEQFLGVLRAQELLVHGDTPVEAIRASMRERRHVLKAIKRYSAALAHSRLVAGDLSELEILQRRASQAGQRKPIHILGSPRASSSARMHVDDIADGYTEDN